VAPPARHLGTSQLAGVPRRCRWRGGTRDPTAGCARRRPIEKPKDAGSIPATSTLGSSQNERRLFAECGGRFGGPRSLSGRPLRCQPIRSPAAILPRGTLEQMFVCGRQQRLCITFRPRGRLFVRPLGRPTLFVRAVATDSLAARFRTHWPSSPRARCAFVGFRPRRAIATLLGGPVPEVPGPSDLRCRR